MDDSTYTLRNRTVGRNTSSSYRDISRIRPTPYPVSTNSSPIRSDNQESPRRRLKAHQRLSLSPPKRTLCKSPTHASDRFIPHSSSMISLRHLLSSPARRSHRDGSKSPTNPQLQSPGKEPEWPNSYDDTILSYRLASALEIPLSPKLLLFHSQPYSPTRSPIHSPPPEDSLLPSLLDPPALLRRSQRRRIVPPDPFRILDAPDLRDDYYSEPLSWCRNGTLAVALGIDIFLWSKDGGVTHLPNDGAEDITSVAFNQTGDILAIAREDGSVLLYSPKETIPRVHIAPISVGAIGALAWRPNTLPSMGMILHESLIIGTYDGQVLLCEIAWNLDVFNAKVERRGLWNNIHDDQICGIAWSNDGLSFATGANDNKVCTYEIPMGVIGVNPKWEKRFHWVHEAAVKALAFKSGKGGVLATGGGVHDKKIRFYNTHHGTLISSLDVCAQITTLIWSPSTTEILATFGYTAPGTSTKCAVYAFPSLQCLFSFEIADETRALYAVPNPSRTEICLAGSDECVRFYHIWGDARSEKEGEDAPRSSVMRELAGVFDPPLQLLDRTTRVRNGLSEIR